MNKIFTVGLMLYVFSLVLFLLAVVGAPTTQWCILCLFLCVVFSIVGAGIELFKPIDRDKYEKMHGER